jgi:NAD(P)-dependent dehydrogenase (short-subunit alcohol dehydrogenase family)
MSFLNLENRVVVIAGAAGGIGSEIARVLIQNGARVALADLNLEAAMHLAQSLGADTDVASGYSLNLLSDDSVKDTLKTIASRQGPIYGVVNAVGIVGPGSALSCSTDEYHRQLEVNCFGAMRLARGFVDHVKTYLANRSSTENDCVVASYVYISSIAADLAIPDRDPYCVSKAAGQAFHLNLANEVAQYGINVNVVLPGRTDTPAANQRAQISSVAALQMYATQRRAAMIPTETIAKTCAFLLCPDLLGYSGQKLIIAEGADTTYRPSYEALERSGCKS